MSAGVTHGRQHCKRHMRPVRLGQLQPSKILAPINAVPPRSEIEIQQ